MRARHYFGLTLFVAFSIYAAYLVASRGATMRLTRKLQWRPILTPADRAALRQQQTAYRAALAGFKPAGLSQE